METLLTAQDALGKELNQAYSNFKRDSMHRKTIPYLNNRIEKLQDIWKKFEDNHAIISQSEQDFPKHPYFENRYYQAARNIYEQYLNAMNELKQSLEKQEAGTVLENDDKKLLTTNPGQEEHEKLTSQKNRDNISENMLLLLIRKHKALITTVTRILQDIEEKKSQEHSKMYYEYKLTMLQKYELEINYNNQSIWELSDEEQPHGYKADYFSTIESWLQDEIISLQEKIEMTNSATEHSEINNHPNLMANNRIKLPKIKLPSFDGNYAKWIPFKELYTKLIHEQLIDNAQKMFYLVSNLTGEACTLIQHIPISNENYKDAWDTLCGRYDNKRLLVTALLNRLFNQSAIRTESSSTVKQLHDTTKECLLGLKNLGLTVEAWDPIIVHTLIKKFDKATHSLYEQSLKNPRELNTLKGVLEFLETRFQSLETLDLKGTSKSISTPSRSSLLTAGKQTTTCFMCQQNHKLYSCKAFLAKSPSERLQLLKNHKRCINCLQLGHIAKECTLRHCTKCPKKHNTLVHLETKSTQDNKLKFENKLGNDKNESVESQVMKPLQTTNTTPVTTTLSLQTATSRKSYVILSTASKVSCSQWQRGRM